MIGAAAEAEEWHTSRHVEAGTTTNAEANVLVTDDFVAVDGRMKMATGLKHVEGAHASMKRAAKQSVDNVLSDGLQAKIDAAEAAAREREKLEAGANLHNNV